MKLFISLLSILCFTFISKAQNFYIKGKVLDNQSKALEQVLVVLKSKSDSNKFQTTFTNETGIFLFEKLEPNEYVLEIKTLNSEKVKQLISINNSSITLSDIIINTISKTVKETEISAEKKLVENHVDKKVYNVDKNLLSTSGSAVDALSQIPNIQVDVDGNIQLRGSEGLLILINGKPTGIQGANIQTILQQIPANSIDKIEIITNPSSRYDAEGASGVINIILKKSKKVGFNGTVNAQIGTNKKYNGGIGLTYTKNKISISGNYGIRIMNMWWNGYLNRYVNAPDTQFYFQTKNDGNNYNISHSGNLSFDYYINKFQTITLSSTASTENKDNVENINYFYKNNLNIDNDIFRRQNLINNSGNFNNYNLYYKKTYTKPGKELTVGINYTKHKNEEFLTGENKYELINKILKDSLATKRENNGDMTSDNKSIQIDFIDPVFKINNLKLGKIETGIKTTQRFIDNAFSVLDYDYANHLFFTNTLLSNHFKYTENINAAYITIQKPNKYFEYQIGARLEQTIVKSELKTSEKDSGYNYLNFFPTAFILKKIKSHEIKLNYSKRIERPSQGQVNPFSDLSDPLNIRQGNPFLKPQFIHNVEFDYSITKMKWMFNPGLYFKYTDQLIWRYIKIVEGINYITFENIGKNYNYGLDWIFTTNTHKWYNTNTGLNVFRSQMIGNIGNFKFNTANIQYTLKHTSNFKIKKLIDLQLTYNYRSPFLTPQGKGRTIQSIDAGLRMAVLKGKGFVNLTFSDVFNTRFFAIDLELPNIDQNFYRKMESRIFYIGFNYRFGDNGLDKKPKKREIQEDRNMDIGM